MRIMAVDNNISDVQRLTECLTNVYSGKDEIVKFTDPLLAVKYGINNKVDILYTEIDMRGMDGFSLINLLRQHNPEMKANIVTTSGIHRGEALRNSTSAYLLKPISIEAVKRYIQKKIRIIYVKGLHKQKSVV